MCTVWEKFIQPEVAMPPHPHTERDVAFLTSPPQIIVVFHLISALKHEAPAGKCDYSAKFCKGNYSSVAAGASTITPLQSSGINRHNVDREKHMPQHTPVHKAHANASKRAHTGTLALFQSVFYMHKSSPPTILGNTSSTITQ